MEAIPKQAIDGLHQLLPFLTQFEHQAGDISQPRNVIQAISKTGACDWLKSQIKRLSLALISFIGWNEIHSRWYACILKNWRCSFDCAYQILGQNASIQAIKKPAKCKHSSNQEPPTAIKRKHLMRAFESFHLHAGLQVLASDRVLPSKNGNTSASCF